MEMIMISPCQLKVMMDANDMIKYDLCSEGDDATQLRRRDALRRILRKAKDQTGFDSEGSRVTVRMFPSRDGGCEMFVTLTGSGVPEQARGSGSGRTLAREGMTVYSFDSFGALLSACRRIRDAGYAGESCAYRSADGSGYYLALEGQSPLACEMGGAKMKRRSVAYINEHCSFICSSAGFILAKYC